MGCHGHTDIKGQSRDQTQRLSHPRRWPPPISTWGTSRQQVESGAKLFQTQHPRGQWEVKSRKEGQKIPSSSSVSGIVFRAQGACRGPNPIRDILPQWTRSGVWESAPHTLQVTPKSNPVGKPDLLRPSTPPSRHLRSKAR